MPLSSPPTFKGGFASIGLGTAGQVLTSNGTGVAPSFQGSGGASAAYLSANVPAGANNDFNPGGTWPAGIRRLDLDPNAGASNLTGLVAGSDGQEVFLFNPDAANNLTLNSQNAGSAAANRFQIVADLILSPNAGCILLYYAGSINRWRVKT